MRQTLMQPVAVEPGKEDAALLLENLELLEQFGFGCEDFGDGAILVREVPADLDAADTAATLEEFANAVGAGIAVISTDTSADTDSANARVIAALGEAQVFVTENDPIGVMIGMGKDISAGYASIANNY